MFRLTNWNFIAYLHRRDLATLEKYEKVNHNMTGSVNVADPSVLFSSNTSCILTPENTIGPYYVSGELLRQDVTEGQQGVPLHLEMQFVDVNTCEPVPDLLIDIWAVRIFPTNNIFLAYMSDSIKVQRHWCLQRCRQHRRGRFKFNFPARFADVRQ